MNPYDEDRRTIVHPVIPVESSIWTRRGLWPSVMLGAVVGFAATVILGLFGAATGLVAGAAVADDRPRSEVGERDRSERRTPDPAPVRSESRIEDPVASPPAADSRRLNDQSSSHPSLGRRSQEGAVQDRPAVSTPSRGHEAAPRTYEDSDRPVVASESSTKDERDAMKGAAVGGAFWLILTSLAAGLIGGWVAGRFAQVYRSESTIVGVATWAVGILIMVSLAAFGASGLLGGLGAGAGEFLNGRTVDVDPETAKAAAAAAGIATWGFLVAMLLGLGASILGASRAVRKQARLYVRPEPPMTTAMPVSPAMP